MLGCERIGNNRSCTSDDTVASYKFKVEVKSRFVVCKDANISEQIKYHELVHKTAVQYLALELPTDVCLQEYIAYKMQYNKYYKSETLSLKEYEPECTSIDTALAELLIKRISKKQINLDDFR